MKVIIGYHASRIKIGEIEKFEMRNKKCNAKKFVDHHANNIKTDEIKRDAL